MDKLDYKLDANNIQNFFDSYVKPYRNNDGNVSYYLDDSLLELPKNNDELRSFTKNMYGVELYVSRIESSQVNDSYEIDITVSGTNDWYAMLKFWETNMNIMHLNHIMFNNDDLYNSHYDYFPLDILFYALFGCCAENSSNGMHSCYYMEGRPNTQKSDFTSYDLIYIESFISDLKK